MKKFAIVAAFAVACLSLACMAPAAFAQTVSDAASYEVTLEAPMPARGAEFATPTQFVPDGEVEVPYGDFLADLLTQLLGLAGIAAAWLLRRVPANIVATLDQFAGAMGQGRVNELLEKAVTYGINTTAGAARGRTLTVKVGNEVAERAFEYALRHAPKLVSWLGGIQALREMIIARLDLEPDAELPSPRPPAETLISSASTTPAPAQ
jgi:hypothetical protein